MVGSLRRGENWGVQAHEPSQTRVNDVGVYKFALLRSQLTGVQLVVGYLIETNSRPKKVNVLVVASSATTTE